MIKIDKEQLKAVLRELLPDLMAEGVLKTIKGGEHTYYLTNDMLHIASSMPKVKLEGSEASAMNLSLRENAGYIEIYDETAAAVRTKWSGTDGKRNTPLISVDELADGCLTADATGRAKVADGFLSADTTGRAKMVDGFLTEAKISSYAADGLHPKRIARATYDYAEHGGAISTIGLGVTLPDNAIVIRSWYEVITTLTSATDAATIAIDIPTDDPGGIVAAIAISDASNPWDVGLHEATQDGTVANASVKTTSTRELSVTIGTEEVTAGKFVLFAEYMVSD